MKMNRSSPAGHPSSQSDKARSDASPRVRIAVSLAAGILAGIAVGLMGHLKLVPLIGWDVAAAVFCVWMWATIAPLGPKETERRAEREDPGKRQADALLLVASVASLIAVGVLLVQAGHAKGLVEAAYVGLGVLSVILSWTMVHTRYTLHYAHLYYSGENGGIDFGGDDSVSPCYMDFAYLAFTIGMTFQVSDTSLQTKEFRVSVLHHALLSYLFGTVIVATAINLIAGLSK
jgi:uncharacterized membrane protein